MNEKKTNIDLAEKKILILFIILFFIIFLLNFLEYYNFIKKVNIFFESISIPNTDRAPPALRY